MKRWLYLFIPFALFLGFVLAPRPARAALTFCNNTASTVYVAVATDDGYSSTPNPNNDWVAGWYQTAPGACKTAIDWAIQSWDDVYYYANSDNGQTWSGSLEYCVNAQQRFTYYEPAKNTCLLEAQDDGFRYIPYTSADSTVSLTIGSQPDEELGSSDNWLKCTNSSAAADDVTRACNTLIDYAGTIALSEADLNTARLSNGKAMTQLMSGAIQKGDYQSASSYGLLAQSNLQLASPQPDDDLAAASQIYGVALLELQKYEDSVSEESYAMRLSPSTADYHAYWVRGSAYLGLEKPQEAYDDETKALGLGGSKISGVYQIRAAAEYYLTRYDDALTDVQNAIGLDPSDTYNYRLRGEVEFVTRRFASAAYDLRRSVSNDPAYIGLWIFLSQAHLHQSGKQELANNASSVTAWPAPIIAFYLGHGTRANILAAAKDADPHKQANQQCEAAYYLGEWELLHGAKKTARADFHHAAQTCPQAFIERPGALSELARMK